MKPRYCVCFVYGHWTWIKFRLGITSYHHAASRGAAVQACFDDGAAPDQVEIIKG